MSEILETLQPVVAAEAAVLLDVILDALFPFFLCFCL